MTWQARLYKDHPMIAKEMERWINKNRFEIIKDYLFIESKPKYFVRMERVMNIWVWYLVTYNGHEIGLCKKHYTNKAQCRNIGKRFAESVGLKWRE